MRAVRCLLIAVVALAPLNWVSSQDAKDSKQEAKKQEPKGVKLSSVEEGILKLVNEARAEKNLQPLSIDPILLQLARDHSENQAKQHKMSHQLDGKSPFDRIKASSYRSKTSGENVAYDQGSWDPLESTCRHASLSIL